MIPYSWLSLFFYFLHFSETHNNDNIIMGNSSSSPKLNKGPIQGQIGSMGTLRTHTTRRPPMPDENEIGIKFNQVLLLMDLQPEKVKQLQQLPLTKKWEMICDQVCVNRHRTGLWLRQLYFWQKSSYVWNIKKEFKIRSLTIYFIEGRSLSRHKEVLNL